MQSDGVDLGLRVKGLWGLSAERPTAVHLKLSTAMTCVGVVTQSLFDVVFFSIETACEPANDGGAL